MLRWRLASLIEYKSAQPASPRAQASCRSQEGGEAHGQFLVGKEKKDVATSSIVGLLANAFSHCSCHMCKDGAVTCSTCRGSGREHGEVCIDCDGLGALPCRFCGGTRWADPGMIPLEFATEVLKRQQTKTLEDAQRLLKGYRWMVAKGLSLLNRRRRGRLARLTIRLRSRLENLLSRAGDDARPPLSSAAIQVGHCARLLASHAPSA